MDGSAPNAAAAAVGAVAADVTDVWLRRGRFHTPRSAAILVGAALVYPLAGGPGRADRDVVRRESTSVAAALAVALAAVALPDRAARPVVAAGWILHAVFDQVHAVSAGSRLPRWYPALCAGYDAAMATALSRK